MQIFHLDLTRLSTLPGPTLLTAMFSRKQGELSVFSLLKHE